MQRVCLECNIPQRTETAVRCGRPRSVWPESQRESACSKIALVIVEEMQLCVTPCLSYSAANGRDFLCEVHVSALNCEQEGYSAGDTDMSSYSQGTESC